MRKPIVGKYYYAVNGLSVFYPDIKKMCIVKVKEIDDENVIHVVYCDTTHHPYHYCVLYFNKWFKRVPAILEPLLEIGEQL